MVCCLIYVTIMTQYLAPHIIDCVDNYNKGDLVGIVTSFLRIPVPNTYAWLVFFYFSFHTWLNLMAEITGFADRLFYKDWWNSESMGEYWRTWNLPVHNWFLRHVYFPLRRRKYGRNFSLLVIFTCSALMHEYAIAGIFKVVTGVGFFGIFF
jgi:diacylglycerol O-acyltransferase-1